jgi:uncharacterized 2Fe-2S/4Fe-4S cluster protein (DUF4445 family)
MIDKKVTVHVKDIGSFSLPEGTNLREALRREGVYLDGTCADQGRCGRCVIRIIQGDTRGAGDLERGLLGDEALADGDRLACRVNLSGNLTIAIEQESILELDRTGRWKETWDSPLWHENRYSSSLEGYGICVDLGTTSVASALFNPANSKPMDLVASANPQAPWGEEILSRLAAAHKDEGNAGSLQDVLLETVSYHLKRLCSRNGISTRSIQRVVFVGNSAIHHLALGLPVSTLLSVPFSPSVCGEQILSPKDLPIRANLKPDAQFIFPPLIGGFVGSDLTGSLLAARAMGKSCGVLMDTGTNSEIAIWSGNRILATSAAAGPAFEGGHIRFGMRAEEGAIYRVALTRDGIDYKVVGGGPPTGICGTGILDVVAEMIKWGLVDPSGLVQKDVHPCQRGNVLVLDDDSGVIFEPRDVETVQKAKAALSAALGLLMKRSEINEGQIEEVYLAGAFGGKIDLTNAFKVGLLPPLPERLFVMAGNAALVGASFILLSDEAREESRKLAETVEHVAIADDPEFEELYLESLFF